MARINKFKSSAAMNQVKQLTFRHPVTHKVTDPLFALGCDVLHLVLTFLPVADLLVAEQVSQAWKGFVRFNGALWRVRCLETVDKDEVTSRDAHERERERALRWRGEDDMPDRMFWRELCLSLIPMTRAWDAGRAVLRPVVYQWIEKGTVHHPEGHAQHSVLVAPGLFVQQVNGTLRLSAFNKVIQIIEDVPTYERLEACSGFIVGLRINNHLDSACPKPKPTQIEVWRYCPGTKEYREHLRSMGVLKHAPLWGYSLRLRLENPATADARVVIALMASETRLTGTHPSDYWCGTAHVQRAVHMWHLGRGGTKVAKHEKLTLGKIGYTTSFEFDSDYIFLPSVTDLHIYSRKDGAHIVSLPSPPRDAPFAFSFRTHEFTETKLVDLKVPLPVTHVIEAGVSRAEDKYDELMHLAARKAHKPMPHFSKCRMTKNDLVVTCSSGAISILKNYRAVLASLASVAPRDREYVAAQSTILLATGERVDDVATYGDRIAFRMSSRRESLVTIDARDLPSLQLPSTTDKAAPPPRITARVFSVPRPRDYFLPGAMTMDATGVFCPTQVSTRAYFFGSYEWHEKHLAA